MEESVKRLIQFTQGMLRKENGKELYLKYQKDLESIKPQDVFLVANEQLKMGISPKEMLSVVDKLINVFYKSLTAYSWQKPEEGSFLYYMMEENRVLVAMLDAFKVNVKKQEYGYELIRICDFLAELEKYNSHLQKLENILFPYLERVNESYEGLKILWSLHDEVRSAIKEMKELVDGEHFELKEFHVQVGQLFFALYGLVQKQELILFPSASEVLTETDFRSMQEQSFDYPFFGIEEPIREVLRKDDLESPMPKDLIEGKVKMGTGTLSFVQLESMLNALPVDLTFVDSKDEVAFFNRAKDRFFPRSVAVIGRNVRNCHPPESVHVVEKIIENFRQNKKDQENFWIQMKGKYILIQYFAVRSEEGEYLGTLEVSQEISNIRALEGEKRLMDEE